MAEPTVRSETHDGGIVLLTLSRPDKRNALSIAMRAELIDLLERLRDDNDARAVVITGEPPVFSAGFDLKEFGDPSLARPNRYNSTRYHHALWSFPKPAIAAVNGAALAGGFDLTLLCDLRIASTEAAFAHPEIKFGAPPLFTPLRWIVGDGIARDICLTGRQIDAAEAERIGLVSRVVEPGALIAEALDLGRKIAEAPAAALQQAKRYMFGNSGFGFDDSFRVEHDDVFDRLLTGETGSSPQPG